MLEARSNLLSQHTEQAVRARLDGKPVSPTLRDAVYGAIDGAVTTFAVVASARAAGVSPDIVLVLGCGNLLADGFSMAAGNYLGVKADLELRERIRKTEEAHIRLVPEGEREEIRQIFRAKGFQGDALETAVGIITSDKNRWIETMLREEFGLSASPASPLHCGLTTFAAFLAAGSLPLAAHATSLLSNFPAEPFWWSAFLTSLAFFTIGALKGRVVQRPWASTGLETFALGGIAATLAYAVGVSIKVYASP